MVGGVVVSEFFVCPHHLVKTTLRSMWFALAAEGADHPPCNQPELVPVRSEQNKGTSKLSQSVSQAQAIGDNRKWLVGSAREELSYRRIVGAPVRVRAIRAIRRDALLRLTSHVERRVLLLDW